MKKYVVLANIGTHKYVDGQHLIDCTIKETKFVADNDSPFELAKMIAEKTNGHTIYANDGKWYSLQLVKRATAKYELTRLKKG